jgi:hypothetical protein
MTEVHKSVLAGVAVDDKAFPLRKPAGPTQAPVHSVKPKVVPTPLLVIVGHCPQCGAPIHGREFVHKGELPDLQYGCMCPRPSPRPGAMLS